MAQVTFHNVQAGKTQGNTVVFQGAPGAGKTALLDHLQKTLQGECDTAKLKAASVRRPHTALLEVLKQLNPKQAKKIRKGRHVRHRSGLNTPLELGRDITTTDNPKSISTVEELMALRKRKKPLLLFLDEAQNANGDEPDGTSSILQELHEGDVGNVALIAGGLSDTSTTLKSLGISRLASDSKTTLQPLGEAHVREALDAFLAHTPFGIDCHGHDTSALQQLVVNESFGWPQHLTNALRSLGEELIRVGGRLAECDLHAVQQASQARRESYYGERAEGISSHLLRAVIQTVPRNGTVSSEAVKDAIAEAYQTRPIMEDELPRKEAWRHLVHRGILEPDAHTDQVRVPIPSMHDYIAERTRSQTQETPAESDLGY